MTRYEITIQHTQGKNKGLSVSYAKKNLATILEIAKEAILKGDKVEIESYEIESKDFCGLILENC